MWYWSTATVTFDNVLYFYDGTGPVSPTLETVYADITGLVGTIILANNIVDTLTESANGVYAFADQLPLGASYSVTVLSTPPGQIVTLINASGIISGPTAVTVQCSSIPSVTSGTGRAGGRIVLQPKKVSEEIGEVFDFISSLAPGETITSATTTAVLYTGTDPNPTAIIAGSPTIAGTTVVQGVAGGLVGQIYGLLCQAATSLNQTISISAFLAVIPDFP